MPADWEPGQIQELLDADEQLVRQRLHGIREDLHEVVAASVNANADDEHDPEGSTIAFERQQIAAFAHDAEQRLAEIAAARQRLQDGRYGICADCALLIPTERLQARPAANYCIECA